MSYIQKVLSSEEKLISLSRLHWIYFVQGISVFALFFGFGFIADHYLEKFTGLSSIDLYIDLGWFEITKAREPFKWVFGIAGLSVFLSMYTSYISTEVGLTDKRIIYKKGLIFIVVQQVDLEDIRAENVSHGWLGWLFRYGKLHFDCRFIDDLYLPAISKPYQLVKAAHVARMRHPDIPYSEKQLDLDIQAIETQRRRAFNFRAKEARALKK